MEHEPERLTLLEEALHEIVTMALTLEEADWTEAEARRAFSQIYIVAHNSLFPNGEDSD